MPNDISRLLFNSEQEIYQVQTKAPGPAGRLPVTDSYLRERPSGDLFGMTQNAGMGWKAQEMGRKEYLILSTLGGLREPGGEPLALGYHVGHWELGMLVEAAARELRALGTIPFAAYCSDPCDGRSQGTPAMWDSLPYRNEAALVFRRLIRSLPTRSGVLGVATCDKGLPAMMMALAGMRELPSVLIPGGVTLPPVQGEDAGLVQSLGARYSHGLVSLEEAAELACRACASPGGGCQFLGTAATSQVVGEALGISVPHAALAPSGQPVWREMAIRSARALVEMERRGLKMSDILTEASLRNAMAVHAAFGGSTNLLLHVPAIAHAARLARPSIEEWININHRVPRLVDVLPNGPQYHPTIRVFLAGGVPEVMFHLRELGVIDAKALTVTGLSWNEVIDGWMISERRKRFRNLLMELDGVDPDDVILPPARAAARGLTSTIVFPRGNLAPEGSVIKSTAMDPEVIGPDGAYRMEGQARVFTRERDAIQAIKCGLIHTGDVIVLMGCGPLGSGMEETYQVTSALRHLPVGKHVALITDARFSGVSTGACIGHVGPEARAGGPLGKLRDGDRIRIWVDRRKLLGSLDFVGESSHVVSPEEGAAILAARPMHPDLQKSSPVSDDTRLWAALQQVSGGSWGGCVFDADKIIELLQAGEAALKGRNSK